MATKHGLDKPECSLQELLNRRGNNGVSWDLDSQKLFDISPKILNRDLRIPESRKLSPDLMLQSIVHTEEMTKPTMITNPQKVLNLSKVQEVY